MTYLHYLQVECGVSTEKTPMVLALTHLWWLGSEPNEKQIPSTRTIDASFEQVIAAEDHLFAIKLDRTLTLRPWVKLSYCFDATKNVKGEQVNNLIMTATLLDFEGYDEEAVGGKKAGYGADGYPLDMLVERRVELRVRRRPEGERARRLRCQGRGRRGPLPQEKIGAACPSLENQNVFFFEFGFYFLLVLSTSSRVSVCLAVCLSMGALRGMPAMFIKLPVEMHSCLLYTSDAADE